MTWVEIGFLMLLSFIIIPLGDNERLKWSKQTIEKSKFQNIQANRILNSWLIILFIASILNSWFWCKYIFGLLLIIRSLWAIKDTLTNELKILWFAIIEFIVAVGLGCYLIYTIPDPEMKTIVLQISASTFGGLITLVGVSWTIIAGRKEQRDIQRNQIKPIIYAVNPKSKYDTNNTEYAIFGLKTEEKSSLFLGIIQNTDNGVLIIKKAIINNVEYIVQHPVILRKNATANVRVYTDDINFSKVTIVGTDIQNNEILYDLIINKDDNDMLKIEYIVERQ